ncbi:DUF5960 family protein [Streptococcus pyogenes]
MLREMAMSHKNYFKLIKENSKDGREHCFYFQIVTAQENRVVRKYLYTGLK